MLAKIKYCASLSSSCTHILGSSSIQQTFTCSKEQRVCSFPIRCFLPSVGSSVQHFVWVLTPKTPSWIKADILLSWSCSPSPVYCGTHWSPAPFIGLPYPDWIEMSKYLQVRFTPSPCSCLALAEMLDRHWGGSFGASCQSGVLADAARGFVEAKSTLIVYLCWTVWEYQDCVLSLSL